MSKRALERASEEARSAAASAGRREARGPSTYLGQPPPWVCEMAAANASPPVQVMPHMG